MPLGNAARPAGLRAGRPARRIRVTLPWPPGWDRRLPPRWISCLSYGFFTLSGVVATLAGLWETGNGASRALQGGLAILFCGLALLCVAHLMFPQSGKHARVTLTTVPRTHVTGIAICCSRLRTGALAALPVCLTAAFLAGMAGSGTAGMALMCAAGALACGSWAAFLSYKTAMGWRFVLTPAHVTSPFGRRRSAIAWQAIRGVSAAEVFFHVSTYGGGRAPVLDRYLVLYLCGPDRAERPVSVRPGRKGSAGPNQRTAASRRLKIPVRLAGVAPAIVLYHALRFYLEHQEARAELGTPQELERIASGLAKLSD